MIGAIKFLAQAVPTARTALGEPALLAKSEYDQVLPAGIFRIAFQISCENSAPGCLTFIPPKADKSPSK